MIKIGKTICKVASDTIRICEAEMDGEQCYCIEHITEPVDRDIFSYEEKVIGAIMDRIKVTGIGYWNGFRFKGSKEKRIHGCSLRIFLFGTYNGVDPNSLRNVKIACDTINGITDLRRGRIRWMGGINTKGIDIVERPGHPDEKYIVVEYRGSVEVVEYSDAMYSILTNRSLCGFRRSNKRCC